MVILQRHVKDQMQFNLRALTKKRVDVHYARLKIGLNMSNIITRIFLDQFINNKFIQALKQCYYFWKHDLFE